jgi:NAD(P)-dependent dehydrogenase (short-subunit alcohol dehydrogenase family)
VRRPTIPAMGTEQKPLGSGFGPQTTAEDVASGFDLRRKVIVVTGGHSGIGLETTRVLSRAGASVIVGARDIRKAEAALSGFERVVVSHLDLADPKSVSHFAEEYLTSHRALDILINNAGIMATPLMRDSRGYSRQTIWGTINSRRTYWKR